MIDEKRIKKLQRTLRTLRRLRREARAIKPILKAGYEALEPDIMKACFEDKAVLKGKRNTATYRYAENLRFLGRLEIRIAELEEEIEILKLDCLKTSL